MRRTKIVCTLGPTTDSVEIIKNLIQNGMDAARVNFSHGTYESHGVLIEKLKEARKILSAPIPLILDTKGPEIRIKTFAKDNIYLERGHEFILTTADVVGDETKVSVTYLQLPHDLKKGSRVLIDDGLLELRVEHIQGAEIYCTVINGGFISSNKGVNIPDVFLGLPPLTEGDIKDIQFGISMGFDYIAASFIRSAADIIKIRKVLEQNGGHDIQIIAKIENREGVDNIDEIIEVADAIMVARGDLGVEIPPEEVPLVQKSLIAKANKAGKPVITATQMLESMVTNPRPTRAEANDVANAIFDGSDAIMLSGETAKGEYPVEAVAMMRKIAEKTENSIDYSKQLTRRFQEQETNITNAISYAACATATELKTTCICSVTQSGFTARMISRHRPYCPIVASTNSKRVWRQLNLLWGCAPVYYDQFVENDKIFELAMDGGVKSGIVKNGDTIVMAIGVPVGVSGSTNTLRVDIVGNVLCKGIGIGNRVVSARSYVVKTRGVAESNFKQGDILVASNTENDLMSCIKKASAIVIGPVIHTENCHAEIVAKALDIPLIICNAKVTDFMPHDALITVDPEKGFVYIGIPQ